MCPLKHISIMELNPMSTPIVGVKRKDMDSSAGSESLSPPSKLVINESPILVQIDTPNHDKYETPRRTVNARSKIPLPSNNKKRDRDCSGLSSPDISGSAPAHKRAQLEHEDDEWALVGRGGKTNTSPKTPTRAPSHHPICWVFITLMSVMERVPENKMDEVGRSFASFIGHAFCHQTTPIHAKYKNALTFKIAEQKITQAEHFSYGKYNFKVKNVKTQINKQAKGIIKLTNIDNFDNFTHSLKQNNPDIIDIQRGYSYKDNIKTPAPTATITFKSEEAPIKLVDLNELVSPALLKPLRCNNCQMHGHTTNKCRKTVKCPHCAAPHQHNQCKNIHKKKCANCERPHSAAFKGCPVYLRYKQSINITNNTLTQTYNNKCHQLGLNPAPQVMPHTQDTLPVQTNTTAHITTDLINKIAPLLVNKTEEEIKTILTDVVKLGTTTQTHISNKQTSQKATTTHVAPEPKNNATPTQPPTQIPKTAPRYINNSNRPYNNINRQQWREPHYFPHRFNYGFYHPHTMTNYQRAHMGMPVYNGNRYRY